MSRSERFWKSPGLNRKRFVNLSGPALCDAGAATESPQRPGGALPSRAREGVHAPTRPHAPAALPVSARRH